MLKIIKKPLRFFAKKSKVGKFVWFSLARLKAIIIKDRRQMLIPKSLGVEGFLNHLDNKKCRYVVLRWFDDLPTVELGGDIDILVHDDDVDIIKSVLVASQRTGGVKCDLYSVSGGSGLDYQGISYYAPRFSGEIIERRVKHRSNAYIPSKLDYFSSLAYHAVYQKGFKSGLVSAVHKGTINEPISKYYSKLNLLAKELSLGIDINLDSLDEYLSGIGVSPTIDTLDRLGLHNDYCAKLCDERLKKYPDVRGLASFIVREKASSHNDVEIIKKILIEQGFDIYLSYIFDESEKQNAKFSLRGGNWGNDKSVYDGGDPVGIIVCLDKRIISPSEDTKKKSRLPDNERIFSAKYKVREHFFRQVIHSADNSLQSLHYIDECIPNSFDQILNKLMSQQKKAPYELE